MISNYINAHQDVLALAVCMILTVVCYIYQIHNCRRLSQCTAVLYALFAVWKTVFSRRTRDSVVIIDILWSYRAVFSGIPGMLSQIYLNIMLFIPFGLFTYSAFSGKRKGICATILGMILSVLIELMQLCLRKGTFELDDILNNTIGTIVGASIAYGIECICTKQEKKLSIK